MKKFRYIILLVLMITSFLINGCNVENEMETQDIDVQATDIENSNEGEDIMKIIVDYSVRDGIPLFKKFALFNSGIAPLSNYIRDMYTIMDLGVESLRLDLFIGNSRMPFGNTVHGTKDKLEYDFSQLDTLAYILEENGITPYWSWCYIPLPLQLSNDWRNGPNDLNAWKKMFEQFSKHYRDLGMPIYHEIYNEPDCGDIFFLGTWDDYLQMYKYAAQGLKEGDPDAVVGGPSTAFIEQQAGIDNFLQMVMREDLPLDFFSFHSYGNNYSSRVNIARENLSQYPQFDTTEMHMNELNAIPAPWPENGDLDKTMAAVKMLSCFDDLLNETDVTLVHWAQWLSSTVAT